MRNDRDDDKYDSSENSEYHFSDDSYEVDAHAAKQQSAGSDVTVDKSAKSKRMYISLGVFLVLVVVVYKMVAPSATQPSLEINHQAAANTSNSPAKNAVTQTAAATQQASVSNSVIPVQSAPATQQPAAPTSQQQQLDAMQNVLQAQQANTAAQMAAQQQGAAPVTAASAPSAQQAANNMQQMINQTAQAAAAPATASQQASPASATTAMQNQGAASFGPSNQMPQGPQGTPMQMASTTQMSTGGLPTTNAVTTNNSPVNQAIDANAAMMNNQINSASAAAEADTARRMAEFQNQNKNLQDQVQLMNSRMALIESQMNQLVQTLTQQFQGSSGGLPSFNPAQSPSGQQPAQQQQVPPSSMLNQQPIPDVASAPVRLPYNVQAIIPGRAWLRSNTGDTITVAENDDIKGIGRVTKIDPYDGIVTIDVHGKPVSLSYGNSN